MEKAIVVIDSYAKGVGNVLLVKENVDREAVNKYISKLRTQGQWKYSDIINAVKKEIKTIEYPIERIYF